jgi:hypothetical protein
MRRTPETNPYTAKKLGESSHGNSAGFGIKKSMIRSKTRDT